MRIPVDTSVTTFMAAAPARPATDFQTGKHKTDANGELLFKLQVVALDQDGAQVWTVTLPGDPGAAQGAMLEFAGLVAIMWSMGDRKDVAFRARGVKVAGVAEGASNGRA